MTKILYIDEEAKEQRKFIRYASQGGFHVEVIEPHDELNDLLNFILGADADAVIVDHRLGDKKASVDYDGADVYREFRKKRSHFPFFILTSYDNDAIAEAEDVNCVYPKSVVDISDIQNSEIKVTFNDRIRAQIEHYKKRIDQSEQELSELIEKSDKVALTAIEEARIIELDHFINHEVDKSLDIPEHLKTTTNIQKIQELIDTSNKLMDAIANKKPLE